MSSEIVRRIPSQHDYGAAPLTVVFFSNHQVDLDDPEIQTSMNEADLIIALGNVDLDRLASYMPADTPALCVRGDRDGNPPPQGFRELHGEGVLFKGWRIIGLGGTKTVPGAPAPQGLSLTEDDAYGLIGDLDACDLLITHAPPEGANTPHGFRCLTEILVKKPPIYHFYATKDGHQSFAYGDTLLVGVSGALAAPELVYA